MDVSNQFNSFAGKEVTVTEKPWTRTSKYLGEISGVSVILDNNDPVVKELNDAVTAAGLHLRLWLPGTMGTMDYRLNRVNAHVEKESDGKYRIQPNFNLG